MRLVACALGLEAQLRAIEVGPGGSLSEASAGAAAAAAEAARVRAEDSLLERTQRSDGVHQCACVTAADEERRDLKSLRWLHFPKSGTSFFSTLYAYACREKGPIDTNVSPVLASDGCHACYDFALMERFPVAEYCAVDAFASLEGGNPYCDSSGNGRCPETQHRPLFGGYGGVPRQEELAKTDAPGNTVAMFRDPSTRIESAAQNRHMAGMHPDEMKKVYAECGDPPDPACFASFPGISGCMTRMLTGGLCADGDVARSASAARRVDPAYTAGPFPINSSLAIDRMMELGFVGLTEEWNEAVCLFHKMFGGKVEQAEFKNYHATPATGTGNGQSVERPGTAKDHVDEPLYAAAKDRFKALQREYGTEQCYQLNAQPVCTPQSCEQRGAECAATDDGCGGTVDCGHCPQHRVGPATCDGAKCHAEGMDPSVPDAFAMFSYEPNGAHHG